MESMLKLDDYFGTRNTKNSIVTMFENAGGIDALEEMQKHPNYEIYQLANRILASNFESVDPMNDTGDHMRN